MNKENLILDAIKEKAHGVNRTTRPVYGQGQYDMAYEILNKVEEIINTEPINNGWIPCSERLPDKEGDYLTTVDGCMVVDITLFANGNFIDFLGEEDNSIIAWQPLPQPYKGE